MRSAPGDSSANRTGAIKVGGSETGGIGLGAPTPGRAQKCLDVVGRWGGSRPVGRLAADGDRVVLGAGANLVVGRVNSRGEIDDEGSLGLPYLPHDLALAGDLAVVSLSGARLLLVDLADPANPTLGPSRSLAGDPDDVVAADGLVLVATSSGLEVFRDDEALSPGGMEANHYSAYDVATVGGWPWSRVSAACAGSTSATPRGRGRWPFARTTRSTS